MSGTTVDVDALLAASDSRQQRERDNKSGDNNNGDVKNGDSKKTARGRRLSREDDELNEGEKSRQRERERGRSRSPVTRRDTNAHYDRSRSPRVRSRRDNNGSYRHPHSHRDHHPRDDRRHGRRYDDRNRDYVPHYYDSRAPRPRGHRRSPQAPVSDPDAERHTVFVTQCAARLRSPELVDVFRDAGLDAVNAEMVRDHRPPRNARDRGRHKGMAYVEFKTAEGAASGLNLTGKTVLGVPLLISKSDSEKNNQARASTENQDGAPFHRLYVSNLSYSVADADVLELLSAYGPIANYHVEREDGATQNKGSCWVEFEDPNNSKLALENSQGVDLGGRGLRFGLGNAKTSDSATKRVLDKWDQSMHDLNHAPAKQPANGAPGPRRARPAQQGGPSSALDDTDSYTGTGNQSRYSLMQKLNRTDGASSEINGGQAAMGKIEKPKVRPSQMVTRGLKIENVFDPKKVEHEAPDFFEELRSEIEQECAESYGPVTHSAIDQNSDGKGYVKFADSQDTKKAFESLNGRFFAGLRLSATYLSDAVYNSLYPKSG